MMMESETRPVEVTTRYVTSVPTLAEAWAFVMDRVDRVGPDPTIEIKPVWIYSMSSVTEGTDESERRFEVVVSGMVEEPRDGS
jgi:hypothetical protein